MWSSAGIDRTAVCFIRGEEISDLKSALLKVTRSPKTIARRYADPRKRIDL
ncbi:MAG: hypothetical protein QNJ54_31725 [Prochloraceae cyanobacterium]|nr:hypothetical protein [Prochloraceae cyanobacterium]